MTNITRVKPGDIVDCNVRGRRFTAKVVTAAKDGVLEVQPPSNVSWHTVTARQVEKIHRYDPMRSQYRGGA